MAKTIHITIRTCRVIDGDSMDAMFDHGRKTYSESDVRLVGINTPETKLYDGVTEREKAAGLKVKSIVECWFKKALEEKKTIVFVSCEWEEKFGRLMGDFSCGDPQSLCQYLLFNKLAKPYSGEKKTPFSISELEVIEKFGDK